MLFSCEKKTSDIYFYEGLWDIDYAMSNYIRRCSEESLRPVLVEDRPLKHKERELYQVYEHYAHC